MIALMHVAKNRLDVQYMQAVTYCDVVMGDGRLSWLFKHKDSMPLDVELYNKGLVIAKLFIDNQFPDDSTKGGTHYDLNFVSPYWMYDKMNGKLNGILEITSKINAFTFYKFTSK